MRKTKEPLKAIEGPKKPTEGISKLTEGPWALRSIEDHNEVKRGPLNRAGKKCRLVNNIQARLGSEANFGSHKIHISS